MSETKKLAQASAGLKAVEAVGERLIRFISTAPTLDRDLEVIDSLSIQIPIKPKGLKYLADLTANDEVDLPFLIDHQWSLEKQAGSVKSMFINAEGETETVVKLSTVDNGERVYTLAKEDHLGNSFSIGYSLQNATLEDGVIKNIELTEISAVFKGSNRDARLLEVKSIKEEKSMTELEAKKAQLKALQDEVEAGEKSIVDARKAESETVVKSFQEQTKGLVADIADADHSWETEDEKWDALRPVNELYNALWEAWYMSTTPLEDFNKLVTEFADLIKALVSKSTDVKMSEELSKALDGKTVDDIKTFVESAIPVKPEEPAEVVEETTEGVETKSIEKETKMTDKEKAAVKTIDTPAQEEVEVITATKKLDKYDFAAKQFVAYVNGDAKALKELNQEALESYADQSGTKATYLNTGVVADGGAIVPDARLLADVYTVLEEYSTVANDLRVITLTEGNSLNIASLIQDVIVREVSTEGGKKLVTKPVFAEDDLALREFAGIAIITKKLVRQAAVNVFDILRDSFARAIANKRAELALTDTSSGIINQAGTGVIQVAAVNGIATYAEIRKAPYEIPAGAVRGAKYYLSRAQVAALDGEINPVTGLSTDVVRLDGDGLSGTLANGFRFAVEEELGVGGVPHVVFGSMSRYGILLRQGTVESETFNSGVVNDGANGSNGTDHNLIQDNKLAHRVAFYENVGYPLPQAFAVSEVNNS